MTVMQAKQLSILLLDKWSSPPFAIPEIGPNDPGYAEALDAAGEIPVVTPEWTAAMDRLRTMRAAERRLLDHLEARIREQLGDDIRRMFDDITAVRRRLL